MYTYTQRGFIDTITHFKPDGSTVLGEFSYVVRADGQRLSETFVAENGDTTTTSWQYDALNRLTQEIYDSHDDATDYTVEYFFDSVGNRTTMSKDVDGDGVAGEVTTYSYDDNEDGVALGAYCGSLREGVGVGRGGGGGIIGWGRFGRRRLCARLS